MIALRFSSTAFLALAASTARAQTIWYVDASATPPGSGTLADPYTSIQHAIAQPPTVAGDTLLVLAGTYAERIDFLGKDITVRAQSGAARTILDGGGAGSVVTFQSGESALAVLDGFTLRNGIGTGSLPDIDGGGIHCVGASPTLRNLVVRQNRATRGAGAFFESSQSLLVACTIADNSEWAYTTSDFGVGIYSTSAIVARDCTIERNVEAHRGGGFHGAGTFIGCEFRDNTGQFGGAAYVLGTARFVDCTFEGNDAFEYGAGGGVFAALGTATLERCTLRGNTARQGGGAAFATLRHCTLESNVCDDIIPEPGFTNQGGGTLSCALFDCVVRDNRVGWTYGPFGPNAEGEGGGIWGGTATRCRIESNVAWSAGVGGFGYGGGGAFGAVLSDCDVVGNSVHLLPTASSAYGGGVYGGSAARCRIWSNDAPDGGGAANASLDRCTVTANTSAGTGGALITASGISITNTILWNDANSEITDLGTSTIVAYCDVQFGWPGPGCFALDPSWFAPATGDFQLLAGSPCIDAGDPSAPPDPDGSRADVGALPWIPGYCAPVTIYCEPKINSRGCPPEIGSSGYPRASGVDDFVVTGSGFVNQKSGLLFWGRNRARVPFQGGTLCVQSPLVRTPIQSSGGNPLPPPDCSGTYAFAFTHAYMSSAGILANDTIRAQWYARDPAHPDGTGVSLSNAIEFTVCP